MDEDLSKYKDFNTLPIKLNNNIEEVRAEVVESFVPDIIDDKKKNKVKNYLKDYNKITIADYEKRVYIWLIDGWSNRKISTELMNQFGVKSANAANAIIRRVTKSFLDNEPEDIFMLKARYLELYNDLYSRALEKKDLLTAQKILTEMVRLQGLTSAKVTNQQVNVYNIEF